MTGRQRTIFVNMVDEHKQELLTGDQDLREENRL